MADVIKTIGKYARIPSYDGEEALAIDELKRDLGGYAECWVDENGNFHALREGKAGKLMVVTHVDKLPLAYFDTCEGYAIGKLDNSVGVGVAAETLKNYPRNAHTLEMVGTIGHECRGFLGATRLTEQLVDEPDEELKAIVVIDVSGSSQADEGKGPIIYWGAGQPFQKRITRAASEVAKKKRIRVQEFFPQATNDSTVLAETDYPVVAFEVLTENLHGMVETASIKDIENLYRLFRECAIHLVPALEKLKGVKGYENMPKRGGFLPEYDDASDDEN